MTHPPALDPTLADRWARFEREVALTASGSAPFPVELLTLPGEMVAADQGDRVRLLGPALIGLLMRKAELLAPSTVGPNHHAVSAAVASLEAAGVDVGPFLRYVRTTWTPPAQRARRTIDFARLLPYAAPPKKKA